MVIMNNGELSFGSGERALDIAVTSKEGCRCANYPIDQFEVVKKYSVSGLT